ncbi:MAG: radical SAM protein [bacterium]
MRVLFIYPDVGTMLPLEYQHGLGYLVSALKRAGSDARVLYLHEEPAEKELALKVREYSPGLVGFSTTSNQYPQAVKYARLLKKAMDVPVIIGGVHASLDPENVISEPSFDMLCVGEGEGAIVDLARALERGEDCSDIPNLWVRRGEEIIKNEPRRLWEDLDSLPFPDREAFDFKSILEKQKSASLLSGRGCPFNCAYCANEGLRGLYRGKGSFVRRRSVDNVLEEMDTLAASYEVRKWHFHDDIFTLDRAWVEEFCERYPRKFSVPFDVNVRVETADRDMLSLLRSAGCEWILVGVESGSDRVRREVMGRPMEDARIEELFKHARELGLRTWSFNMVGLPGETEADAAATYELNRRLRPEHMQVSVFNPYPGTRLYEVCKERGVLTGESRPGYFVPESVLDLPEFPAESIREWHQKLIRLRDYCHSRNRLLSELHGPPSFDFVDELASAEVNSPEPGFVKEDYFTIDDDTRRVLMVHPPSRVSFRLRVPRNAVLRFSLALHPQVLERGGGDGVVFTVRAGRRRKKLSEVFSHTLDPKRKPEERGWHEAQVDLPGYGGKKTWIEFETRTVDPTRPEHNTAGFGFPVLVAR